ncbi:MAG: ATP-dependent DNA helicase [Proteobacteria bacterium]|nr:ATP-dependent DNA helicase [Pseudomonadota bacterium]
MTKFLKELSNPIEALNQLPALIVGPLGGVIMTSDGEVEIYALDEIRKIVASHDFLICNLPVTSRLLGMEINNCYDVLELFAFVRPAEFCMPLPLGLLMALKLSTQILSHEDEAMVILKSAKYLILELTKSEYSYIEGAKSTAYQMANAGWRWGPIVKSALGSSVKEDPYHTWNHLSEWEETGPLPPAGIEGVNKQEALARLAHMLGPNSEKRQGQLDYVTQASRMFDVPQNEDEPILVLAEAGTGIGKTLGYIAPSSVWAEKNGGTVWLSTYTKNLQRQLDQELERLYPDQNIKNKRVVIRKGRENYLCLLNLQEISQTASQNNGKILIGLVNRWARYTRDGDMIGGDFPAWLGETFGAGRLQQLTDRRGECVYSACSHYKKCFIEKAQRKSKHATLVIANHALVMVQSATRQGDKDLPRRYVFDEGHHIFDVADSTFSSHLSGQEGLELRRWIRGAEIQNRRGKGLKSRLDDLISEDEKAQRYLSKVISAAVCLASDGWHKRLIDGAPFGPMEHFLSLVRGQVLSRSHVKDEYHSLETYITNPKEELIDSAKDLYNALLSLTDPLLKLSKLLLKKLDTEANELDSSTRNRLEAVSRNLQRRCESITDGWCPMLLEITAQSKADDSFVDWFELNRISGREIDTGMHRHWIDPSIPFSKVVLKPSHGALITSATLRDRLTDTENMDIEWNAAEIRTGAAHFINPPMRHSLVSPFDYEKQSRIFIVNDVNIRSMDQLAAAYRELFLASGGGGLGLFTAINRLKAVYGRLLAPLEENNIPLYAQHIDPINISALVDIFRAVKNSCLLGTDAVRDGVDVPGESLRLCVFDKVPWPRPTILHKARRNHFGKQSYDDLITRLRMKQAFGRLIRKESDKGVFIMMDAACPTRLLSGFPQSAPIERIGLAEAIKKTKDFLS